MENKELEAKKKRLRFWQEVARDKTKEAGEAVRKANSIEKEVYELENGKEKTQSSSS